MSGYIRDSIEPFHAAKLVFVFGRRRCADEVDTFFFAARISLHVALVL